MLYILYLELSLKFCVHFVVGYVCECHLFEWREFLLLWNQKLDPFSYSLNSELSPCFPRKGLIAYLEIEDISQSFTPHTV